MKRPPSKLTMVSTESDELSRLLADLEVLKAKKHWSHSDSINAIIKGVRAERILCGDTKPCES